MSVTPIIDLNQCPCAGVNLDRFIQPMILVFLAQEDLHGYGLIQRIMDSPIFKGDKPDPTGVYRSLKLMEKRQLVVSSWVHEEMSGPPKRRYKITAEGMMCLQRWFCTLQDYVASIDVFLKTADRVLSASACRDSSSNEDSDLTSGEGCGTKILMGGLCED
jgi:PadR family transcriptional regulator PadR